jgi:glycosyltransferase involved in cell wall biosynthesis
MRICYLANAQSIHSQRWAKHFANRGHEVTVISFQFGKIEGVRVISLSGRDSVSRPMIVRLLPKVRKIVREIKPDILHAHYVTSYGLAGAVSGWRPFIATAWGGDVLIEPEQLFFYRVMVRWVLSRADLITSMAEYMTVFMKKRGYGTLEKILTLPFGIDKEQFHPGYRTRRHGEGPPIVISTRHLLPEYDVETLIRAIPLVLKQCSDTRFVIVGDGALRPSLEELVHHLGIQRNIEFLGKVPYEEMPRLLGEADIFVTTSILDGNNISLNEAMACGTFPIVSDIPANREWIEGGKNGLIFPVGDTPRLAEAIVQAIQKSKWWEVAAEQNWAIVSERGSWIKNMAKMEDHYQRLFEMGGRRRLNRE